VRDCDFQPYCGFERYYILVECGLKAAMLSGGRIYILGLLHIAVLDSGLVIALCHLALVVHSATVVNISTTDLVGDRGGDVDPLWRSGLPCSRGACHSPVRPMHHAAVFAPGQRVRHNPVDGHLATLYRDHDYGLRELVPGGRRADLLDVLGYGGRGTRKPCIAPKRDDRTPLLIPDYRPHHDRGTQAQRGR
jgi:hypothetical protein